MDKSQKYNAEQKKLNANSIFCMFSFINIDLNLSDIKQISDFLGQGAGDENLLARGSRQLV